MFLESFAAAITGFTRYALLAHRRKLGPRLRLRNQLLFLAHLAVSWSLSSAFRAARALRNAARRVYALARPGDAWKPAARNALLVFYRLVVGARFAAL